MKTALSKLVGLGAALTMLFAPFTSQAGTNASTTANLASLTQETQSESFHKVIARPGVLDASQEGITLWHDYGAFALYKVSPAALSRLPGSTHAKIQVMTDVDNILLDAYPFNTQTDTFDAIPERFQITQADGPALYLIQFVGPIKDAWLQAIEETGAKPIHYIANYGYLVWADDAARARLDDMANAKDFLQFSAPYQPYFKLGASLNERLTGIYDPEEIIRVTIQMYDHPGKDDTEQLIANLMREQLSPWTPILDYQNVTAVVRVGDLETIATQPDVFWIGEYFERELLDEVQNQILAANFDGSQTGPAGPGYLAWLTGYGFSTNPADYPIVDVTDDGIGNGTVNSGDYTLHELGNIANPTRLQYVGNCTSSADGGGPDGHGHINTSIVGGYDTLTGFPYQDAAGFNRGLGVNPYARLAGTRIFDAGGFDLSACGNTDTGLIKRVQDSGAQIASNSWGCRLCAGSYDSSSQAFDVGVRDADLTEPGNQELIVVFSAGNAGPSAGTVGTPGNGKNMITVGASENDRLSDEDGSWTDGCGVGPTGADNAMDVIGFSSRGPAPGGRVKPEVIAPGTHIQGTASTHASYNGSGVCDQYRPSGQSVFAASSGTSHSAPAVAGVSSLYYYWLENEYGTTPSPALIKAYLIAHPTYLTGASANDTLPSNSQGYGMPNMALAFDDTPRYVVNQTELFDNSGETWTFSRSIADSSKPVRIVMTYTDEPGAIGTSPEVNDLNLEVTVGGDTYLGNNFSGQWSVTGGSADNDNNYEAVFLPPGTDGQIDITITAFNIAGDGVPNTGDATDQDFALVIYNVSQKDLGYLDGTIYDGGGTPATDPISGADVQAAGLTPGHTGHDTSLADGTYRMGLLTDTYTVTVTAYGYLMAEISGVSVVSGTTTTLNIPLTPAAMYVVSGTVTDATTGWPLYASIGIPGYPGGTVWTDPETGFYSVTLPEGTVHTFNVSAWADGYDAASRSVGPLTANTAEDFALTADLDACIAPGYARAAPTNLFFEDFESGMGNWTLTGLWNEENETDVCGSQVAPFPSPSTDAYYGQDSVCTYNTGTSNTGSLQMNSVITLPASGQVWLSFWSYEHTEDSSIYDRRLVEINVDGGGWAQLGALTDEQTWYQQQYDLASYLGDDVQFRFTFDSMDSIANDYFGWMVDNVAVFIPGVCSPQAGGLVVGNVYDANTNAPLVGATVSNDSGGSATTRTTPDPAVDDSFYALFSLAGSHTFTATMSGGYGSDTATVTVVQSDTVRQDFYLPAASLLHDPQTLQTTLLLGESVTLPFTLTNEGELPATFELQEMDQGVEVAALAAARVPGYQVSELKTEESYAGYHLSSHGSWIYQPATDASISSIGADVLLVAAGDATQIQTMLQAYPDINAADYFDARVGTPTLSQLLAYDTAIVISAYAFADPVALGDVLADYVDTGGTVIQTVPTFYGSGWGLQGRFVDEGYSPFIGTGDWFSWADLDDFDMTHPIMRGVAAASDDLRQVVDLNTDADWVADWTDDEFIATKGSVVALNTYLADGYNWTGDVDVIVHNSVIWLQTAADVPWLSESPITGTIAAGSSQVIDVTFDAGEVMQPGQYYAILRVISNDPVNPDQTVPVTMTVQPDPSMGRLQGTVTSDRPGGPLENALVEVISSTTVIISGTTDATGGYGPWWLMNGAYTVRVSATGHLSDTQGVGIVAQQTTTHDVTLTLDAPQIEVMPRSFDETLAWDATVMRVMTITNSGPAPLDFELLEHDDGFTATKLPFASGGPDAFGYTYQDSNEPKGPQFDFVDISASGTPVLLGDDDYDGPFAIGFDFPFYGSYQTQFYISSNGFLSFGSGSSELGNDCPLPSTSTPHNIIALMWDDLDPGDTSDSVYYETFTACPYGIGECLVVQYDGYHHYPGGGSIAGTWEGILFDNGNILIQFEDAGTETGSSSTTGIENASGSDGLTYETCNTAVSLQDNLAICFQYPGAPSCDDAADVPWLSESPITGTVTADSSQVIDVTFDAGAVTQAGQYYATLHVVSSDPANPIQTVPVTMTVAPLPPILSITKTGSPNPVRANQILTYTLVVENTGDGDATGVTITDTIPVSTTFSSADSGGSLVGNVVQWTGKTVPAGGSLTVHFVVYVGSHVSNGDTLSNDTYGVTCAEGVSAVGLPIQTTVIAPVLSITKSSYPDPVQAGGLLTYTIVVENTGDADATDAFIVDGIPTNTTFISADSGGTFSEDPGLGDLVNWGDKTISAGGILTVSFTVRVDSPLPNGTILNNSTYLVAYWGRYVSGSPVQTTVQSAPILDITKSGDRDPIRAGEFLTYTIVVENTGNADATSVTVTDTIPANTTFVSADSGGILAGNQVQWSGKTVPAGGTLTVQFTVLVDDQLPSDSIVTNDTYSVTCAEGVSATGSPVIVHIQNERIIYLPVVVSHY